MQIVLAVASSVLLLLGGFLLLYPTVKPEIGAGWGGRRREWAQKKSTQTNIVREDKYPWTDKIFYTAAWILLVVGTAFGILSFYP
jgi:hypothetical protein